MISVVHIGDDDDEDSADADADVCQSDRDFIEDDSFIHQLIDFIFLQSVSNPADEQSENEKHDEAINHGEDSSDMVVAEPSHVAGGPPEEGKNEKADDETGEKEQDEQQAQAEQSEASAQKKEDEAQAVQGEADVASDATTSVAKEIVHRMIIEGTVNMPVTGTVKLAGGQVQS